MPIPTYATPTTPADGDVLSATHLNIMVDNAMYEHGIAAMGYEPFSGARGTTTGYGEFELWRGYYTYTGAPSTLYIQAVAIIGENRLYVSHDSGETLIATVTSTSFASTYDLAAYQFTVCKKYYARITMYDPTGPGANVSGRVDYAAIPVTNNLAWATPATFTDGNTSSSANFATLTGDENYLQKILEVPAGTFRGFTGETGGGGTTSYCFTGSFIYRGLNTLYANMLFHLMDEAYVKIMDMAGTNVRTAWSGTSINSQQNLTIDLSTLSPALAIGTRYRIEVTCLTSTPSDFQPYTIQRLLFGGTKALTDVPGQWAIGDYGMASSGANRLSYIASSLTDIRTLAYYVTIAGQDYGMQELSAGNGNVTQWVGNTNTFLDFRRTRKWRYLNYLPTATAASGTLTYGDRTQSLADNNGDGTWTSLDLETMQLLPIGFTYEVTGVKACFESI